MRVRVAVVMPVPVVIPVPVVMTERTASGQRTAQKHQPYHHDDDTGNGRQRRVVVDFPEGLQRQIGLGENAVLFVDQRNKGLFFGVGEQALDFTFHDAHRVIR